MKSNCLFCGLCADSSRDEDLQVLLRFVCSVKLRHFRISACSNLVEANRMSDVGIDLEFKPRPKTDGTHLLADRPTSIVTERRATAVQLDELM